MQTRRHDFVTQGNVNKTEGGHIAPTTLLLLCQRTHKQTTVIALWQRFKKRFVSYIERMRNKGIANGMSTLVTYMTQINCC